MNTKDHLTRHDSQISRLEQVMTALAEAQVKTEDDARELRQAMTTLAKAVTTLAETQAKTERQFQAYLNTRPRQ